MHQPISFYLPLILTAVGSLCERHDAKAASAAVTAHMQSALKIVLASGDVPNRSRSRRRSTRKIGTRGT